jgi:hypothetical protein
MKPILTRRSDATVIDSLIASGPFLTLDLQIALGQILRDQWGKGRSSSIQ